MSWRRISCTLQDASLDFLLACGQSFRWRKRNDVWEGVIGRRFWRLQQNQDGIQYEVFEGRVTAVPDPSDGGIKNESIDLVLLDTDDRLTKYLGLKTALPPLYALWSESDTRFSSIAANYPGIRILQQDFLETLFSFICSSNNNIIRIQQMVEKLCATFGDLIHEYDGSKFHAFPDVSRLADDDVEKKLRGLGFGYRAAFVQKSARHIVENPEWVETVMKASYPEAKQMLMELPGVGAKVADCVCLMSLGHHGSVPVDTHVFSVTAQYYLPHLRGRKSVTKKIYDEIGEFYRDRFGPYAGWAHSVLFTADLRRFKTKLDEGESSPRKKRKSR